MLLKMAGGQYLDLSKRPLTQYDWVVLWNMMGQAESLQAMQWNGLSR